MNKAPCKGCTSREAECHSTCKKYLDWQKEHEKENLEIYRKRDLERQKREYIIHTFDRFKKGHRHGKAD